MSKAKYDSINSRESAKDESLSAKEYTTEEAIDHIGFGKFQIKAGLVCALTWIADSMEVNILGVIGPVLKCEWLLEDWQIAIYSSIIFISIAIFSPLVGLLSDRYGRRRILMLTLLTGVYYGTLSAFSPLYIWLVILRFFVGSMLGGLPISTVYTSEFFPKKRRGLTMAIVTSISWGIGSVLEILLAYIVLNWLGWRVWLVASSIPLLFAALLVTFSRNTPRFSLVSGKWNEATETIKIMADWNNSTLPKGELVKSIPVTTTRPFQDRLKDIFSKEYARITILTMIFGFMVQFAYYGTVMASSELISKTGSVSFLGDSSGDKYSCSLNCVTFSQHDLADLGITAVAELIGVFFVDKLGRKLVLALPMVLLGVFTLFLAAVASHRTLLLVSLFGARLVALTPSSFIYVYCAEVYPTPFRTTGVAASFFTGRFGAAVSPFISQVLLNTHPQLGIFVFALAAFIGAVSAILLPVETKGREMKD